MNKIISVNLFKAWIVICKSAMNIPADRQFFNSKREAELVFRMLHPMNDKMFDDNYEVVPVQIFYSEKGKL